MGEARPFSRFVHALLAFTLATSLVPVLAHGEDIQQEESLIDQMAQSNAEETARFAATGNLNDLRDIDAYDGTESASGQQRSVFPNTYDLRNEGVVTSVKFQNPWGTCWGFGAIAASETSIMSELGWTVEDGEVDLSELHTAWFSYTPLPEDAGSQAGEGNHTVSTDPSTILNQGGFTFTATSIFSSGIGPVAEADVPYRNAEGYTVDDSQGTPIYYAPSGTWAVNENLRFAQALELENSFVLPTPASKDESGTYQYNESGTQAIKGQLMAGRGVAIAFAADTSRPGQTDPAKYINTDTWAQYTYDSTASANHVVTIVGWDDDYSRDNFLPGHEPDQNGAWIVKNSWGASDVEFPNRNPGGWGVDGTGYFYLSYYDMSLMEPESFEYYTETYGQPAEYYLIDQYDFMPSTGVTAESTTTPSAMANVFEASERQKVRSLSCETARPGTNVTYELYLLNDGYTSPTDGELLTTADETYPYGGYHRIQLGEGFAIEQGQHYSVVVTQRQGSEYEILVDKALNRTGMDYINEHYPDMEYQRYAVGIVNEGESFLREGETWTDWTVLIAELRQAAITTGEGDLYDYDNFALKAYADPLDEPIPNTTVVPDLNGLTETEALSVLEQAGLTGTVGAAGYSDTIAAGRVMAQDIAAGTEVDQGSAVTYHLSLGTNPGINPAENAADGTSGNRLATTGDSMTPLAIALIALSVVCSATAFVGRRPSMAKEGSSKRCPHKGHSRR